MIQYLLALGTNVQILAPEALQTGYLAAIDRIRDMYRWKVQPIIKIVKNPSAIVR